MLHTNAKRQLSCKRRYRAQSDEGSFSTREKHMEKHLSTGFYFIYCYCTAITAVTTVCEGRRYARKRTHTAAGHRKDTIGRLEHCCCEDLFLLILRTHRMGNQSAPPAKTATFPAESCPVLVCCVLRVAYCVLRPASCVLRLASCVFRSVFLFLFLLVGRGCIWQIEGICRCQLQSRDAGVGVPDCGNRVSV